MTSQSVLESRPPRTSKLDEQTPNQIGTDSRYSPNVHSANATFQEAGKQSWPSQVSSRPSSLSGQAQTGVTSSHGRHDHRGTSKANMSGNEHLAPVVSCHPNGSSHLTPPPRSSRTIDSSSTRPVNIQLDNSSRFVGTSSSSRSHVEIGEGAKLLHWNSTKNGSRRLDKNVTNPPTNGGGDSEQPLDNSGHWAHLNGTRCRPINGATKNGTLPSMSDTTTTTTGTVTKHGANCIGQIARPNNNINNNKTHQNIAAALANKQVANINSSGHNQRKLSLHPSNAMNIDTNECPRSSLGASSPLSREVVGHVPQYHEHRDHFRRTKRPPPPTSGRLEESAASKQNRVPGRRLLQIDGQASSTPMAMATITTTANSIIVVEEDEPESILPYDQYRISKLIELTFHLKFSRLHSLF